MWCIFSHLNMFDNDQHCSSSVEQVELSAIPAVIFHVKFHTQMSLTFVNQSCWIRRSALAWPCCACPGWDGSTRTGRGPSRSTWFGRSCTSLPPSTSPSFPWLQARLKQVKSTSAWRPSKPGRTPWNFLENLMQCCSYRILSLFLDILYEDIYKVYKGLLNLDNDYASMKFNAKFWQS